MLILQLHFFVNFVPFKVDNFPLKLDFFFLNLRNSCHDYLKRTLYALFGKD